MGKRANIVAAIAFFLSSLALSACGGQSPTAVYKTYHAAAKQGDVETMMKCFTQARVRAIRDEPSSYHYLVEMEKRFTGETDGEVINGDKATIRKKDVNGEWSDQVFIREGGKWKLGDW